MPAPPAGVLLFMLECASAIVTTGFVGIGVPQDFVDHDKNVHEKMLVLFSLYLLLFVIYLLIL